MLTRTQTGKRGVDVAAPALILELVIQLIIGYEWLASGITKVASGTFVSGLAADLKGKTDGVAGFYKSFLHDTVIPNSHTFAVLVEVGEVLVGVGLIAAAILWLTRWSRLSYGWRMAILTVTALSALAATFMAINFHLANGANHPWLIPADGFDETIDVDAVLVLIQTAYMVFAGYLLVKIHREHQAEKTVESAPSGMVPITS
jgi:thiosulfate dehydrogenase [quinone] large subunit